MNDLAREVRDPGTSGVIVVGAGPVGLVASCELATRGVDSAFPFSVTTPQTETERTKIGTVRGELATAIRDHAVQMAVVLAPVRHAIATQTEEVALGSRHSSIVLPAHHRHGAKVHARDHLPPMPDADLQARLSSATATPRHVLMTLALGTAPAAVPVTDPNWRQVLVTDTGEWPNGYDDAIADPGHVVATRLGLVGGGRLAVRPDGYIGCIDSLEAFTLDPYLAVLR